MRGGDGLGVWDRSQPRQEVAHHLTFAGILYVQANGAEQIMTMQLKRSRR
jgi:hypothetical protein